MSTETESGQVNVIRDWLDSGSINFIGMPFAGKDAHAKAIGKLLDAPYISGGQILREQADKIPPEELKTMESGGLVSSETYVRMVLSHFSNPSYLSQPLMLSAVGRRDGEQRPTLEAAERSGHPIKRAVVVDITFQEASQRWEEARSNGDRGERADDTYESFLKRFAYFNQFTLPVIDFYVEMGLATRVDGRDSRQEVTNQILSVLAELV